MQGEAPALELGPGARALRARPLRRPHDEQAERARSIRARGALELGVIVALSLFIVLIAANKPSLLAPTTHIGFYPRWMAGPLGGLLPGLTGDSTALRFLFTGAIVAMFIAYALLLRIAGQLPARWVIGAILAVNLIFLVSPPLALTDMFNYINYARMEVVHNLNPYTTIPALEPHSDPAFMLSNWHMLLSPYGPMFTLLTFAVVPLGVAGSFWALKAILVIASLCMVLLVWLCARLLGRDPVPAVALVGLNPIVLVWGLGAGHNDFLMIVCMMLGFYLVLRSRPYATAEHWREPGHEGSGGVRVWLGRVRGLLVPLSPLQLGAGAAFLMAAGIKASGALLIPVVLASLLRAPRALLQVLLGLLLGGALVASASLLAFGVHLPDLGTQGSLVTGESIPNLLGLALGAGGETEALREVMVGALLLSVLACCWFAWRERDPITPSGWANVALLVTLSWVLPWYVLWVLPLAALSRSRRLRAASLVLGAYLILVWAPVTGLLWHTIGFHPEKTQLGRQHQRDVRELLYE